MSSARWKSLPVLIGVSLTALLATLFEIFQRGGAVWHVYVVAFPLVIFAAIFHARIVFLTLWATFTLLHIILDIGFGNSISLTGDTTSQWGSLLLAGLIIHFISTERRRAAEMSERRIRELEIMNEISREISGELELSNLLQKIVERSVNLLGVTLGEILLFDKGTGDLQIVAQFPLEDNQVGIRMKPGEGAMGHVALTKQPLIVNNYKSSVHALPPDFTKHVEATMDVPLLKGNEFMGVLGVASHVKGYHFSSDDLSLLTLLANQATIAIQNAQLYEEVRHLAFTDGLTGINNRRRLLELTDIEHRRAVRYHRPMSFLLMDIDHFKDINDRYGHMTGDAVLQWFAAECTSIIRQNIDVVGRFGGEEFAVMYPETGVQHAAEAAIRIRARVMEAPIKIGDHEITFTISMGIASLPENQNVTLDQLIEKADKALYLAKETRNCIACWDFNESKSYRIA